MSRETIIGLEERIKIKLKERHMTVKKLRDITGISTYVMTHIFDESVIHGCDCIKIAEALDVTTDYLLRGIEDKDKTRWCGYFKCSTHKNLCCYDCPDKSKCESPCLNHPHKCGLVKT